MKNSLEDKYKNKLDYRLLRWINDQNWTDLRSIQKDAIDPILSENTDVIISAATASGKTEAAFLPALSRTCIIENGFSIIYISPLKALINDQYRRLKDITRHTYTNITPWHGDTPQRTKQETLRNPRGVLQITPESLESLIINKPSWLHYALPHLKYIIIDEYHAFVGTERGQHLKSLIHRIETLRDKDNKPIPIIAISATLGNIENTAKNLRPNKKYPCTVITDKNTIPSLDIFLKGYREKKQLPYESQHDKISRMTANKTIAKDIFDTLQGQSNLIFTNSRARTEEFTILLSNLCNKYSIPNEFFPHHGSLSKELRSRLEKQLQQQKIPTTAICTMTLELGIDIGNIDTVAQITPPSSVSSLRQRIGRSGRRNNKSKLNLYITENDFANKYNPITNLRLSLLQSIAIVKLLTNSKWYEPQDTSPYHLSTLLHQTISSIKQLGNITIDKLHNLLCNTGPFNKITEDIYTTLLNDMEEKEIITINDQKNISLGKIGRELTSRINFYAAFNAPKEFRLLNGDTQLGTLPAQSNLTPGQTITFAGQHWKIIYIDHYEYKIRVEPHFESNAPTFLSAPFWIHDRIRKEMKNIYINNDPRIKINGTTQNFIDDTAQALFDEGREHFIEQNLENKSFINENNTTYLIPWAGDKIINTLSTLLETMGHETSYYAGIIEITDTSIYQIKQDLTTSLLSNPPSNDELANFVLNKHIDKYDYLLPIELLNIGYGAKHFDINNTMNWIDNELK